MTNSATCRVRTCLKSAWTYSAKSCGGRGASWGFGKQVSRQSCEARVRRGAPLPTARQGAQGCCAAVGGGTRRVVHARMGAPWPACAGHLVCGDEARGYVAEANLVRAVKGQVGCQVGLQPAPGCRTVRARHKLA